MPPASEQPPAGQFGGGGGRGWTRRLWALTKDEMEKWIAENKDKVRGKVVLIGKAAVIPVNFEPPAKRRPG